MKRKSVLERIHKLLDKLWGSDEWSKVIGQIGRQVPVEEIRCPICGKYELDFEYIINFRDADNPKRNRVGGGWVWCNSCKTTITWDGRIPDWYVESD